MEKKNIDWSNIGFGYMPTDYRYVSMYQNGSWDEGALTSDPNITLNECACVLQYAQTCFEGLKAYTTEDGHIVTFRPDLNGERMENSAKSKTVFLFICLKQPASTGCSSRVWVLPNKYFAKQNKQMYIRLHCLLVL